MNPKQQLDCLFNPRSVAVIGASNNMMKWGFNIYNILIAKGGREVYAVNRNGADVLGLKAHERLSQVPGPVELAVITVPSQDIPEMGPAAAPHANEPQLYFAVRIGFSVRQPWQHGKGQTSCSSGFNEMAAADSLPP